MLNRWNTTRYTILSSSAVERSTVNRLVASSNLKSPDSLANWAIKFHDSGICRFTSGFKKNCRLLFRFIASVGFVLNLKDKGSLVEGF